MSLFFQIRPKLLTFFFASALESSFLIMIPIKKWILTI
jgi:hypothetical protein